MIYLLALMAAAVLSQEMGGKDTGKDEMTPDDMIKACVAKNGLMGKTCTKDDECGDCKLTCEEIVPNVFGCTQCMDAFLEEDCGAMKRSCKWTGDNKCVEAVKAVSTKQCMDDGNFPIAKKCETDDDCDCKLSCIDVFGQKSCTMCADFGDEAWCNESPRGCEWVKEKGMCAKKMMTPTEKIKMCLTEKNVDIGKSCASDDDCECMTTCETFDFGMTVMNSCTQCADFGIAGDCENEDNKRKCVWKEGVCHESMKDGEEKPKEPMEDNHGCAELSGKKCKKAEFCVEKEKKCYQNYKSQCMGTNEDTHGRCHKIDNKGACEEECQENMFGKKCFCEWGMNKMDREMDHRECVKREGAMTCETSDDCKCGAGCVDTKCVLCGDLKVQGPCDAQDMCKWSGDENGACLRKDACKELMFEPEKCKEEAMCAVEGGDCVTKTVDKKVCKKLAKAKKKDDFEAKILLGKKCESAFQCKWNGKKCSLRK